MATQSQSPNFVTQATNFVSAISGAVDPRTGLYGININLGTFVGNKALGPHLPLSLHYSPLNNMDFGLGKGFKLAVTAYQRSVPKKPRALLLSTGEQYGVHEDNGDVILLQQRLKSFTFATQRDQSNQVTGYLVTHKSGALELLHAGDHICLPYKIYTASGQWLDLQWNENQDKPLLQWIKDASGTQLFKADYGNNGTTFHLLPDSDSEGYRVDFNFQNGMLNTLVSTGGDGAKLKWSFTRALVADGSWGSWITCMSTPGGYSELATYPQSGGHLFPQGAPYKRLPYATQFDRAPGGGQPTMTSTYKFSNTNFLGGLSGKNWDASQDSLMSGAFDDQYQYSSLETQHHTDQSKRHDTTIERTYNAYHLEIGEIHKCGLVTQTTAINYSLNSGKDLMGQPPYYQLPASKVITWDNGAGANCTETTSTEWDEWGNPKKRVDPDGAITSWDYYYERPCDQSDENLPVDPNCPKDPHHFVRFAKWMRIDPTHVTSGLTDAPIQQVDYRYANFSTMPNNGQVTSLILKSYEAHSSGGSVDTNSGDYSGGTLLSTATFGYGDNTDAGRLTTHGFTHFPSGADGDSWVKTETFAYSGGANELITTHTLTAHDGLAVTDIKSESAFTTRVLSTTDLQKNVTTYNYDSFGRPRTRTLNSDADSDKNEWTYTNYVAESDHTGNHSGSWPFQILQEDALHNRVCYTMDGHGKVLFTDVNDLDNDDVDNFHTIESKQYDDMGRLSSMTKFDHDLPNKKTYALTETHHYDDWGSPSLIEYSDKTQESNIHDPALKTVVSTNSGPGTTTGIHVSTYDLNFSKKPIKIERYLANKVPGVDAPYSTHTKQYDGLHLLRSETDDSDADGSQTTSTFTTTYQYDGWGRLTQTQLPDSTVVVRQYAETSPDKLVSEMVVSGQAVGTRTFDGLGRVATKTVSGNRWSYRYDAPTDTRPQHETTPDNVQLTYAYCPQLQNALVTVTTADMTQGYDYDPLSGVLSSAASTADGSDSSTTFNLYGSGRLQSESITYDKAASAKQTHFKYTVGGSLVSYQSIDGAVSNVARNDFGRITEVADNDVSVTPTYDGAGRLAGWTAAELVGGKPAHTLTTAIQYDDFNRETSRTVTDNQTGDVWTTTQDWYVNDLLKTRSAAKGSSAATVYKYQYDSRNRLTSWSATQPAGDGPARPRDRYGNEMTGQQFSIDSFGNITCATTALNATPDTNVATFTYDPTHPCVLRTVANTHPTYKKGGTVEYDDAGRITYDGMETYLTYNSLGRVATARSDLTGLSGKYSYDHHSRLYRQTIDNDEPIYFFYKHKEKLDQLVNLVQGDDQQRLFRSLSSAPAAQHNVGSNAGTWLLGADMLGSVVSGSDGKSAPVEHVYSAYGEEPAHKK